MNGQICISRVLDNEQQGIKQIFTKGNSATKNRIRMTMRSFVVLSVCLCLLLTLALLLFFDCFLSLRAISFLFCSCACNRFLDILIFTSLAKLYKLSRLGWTKIDFPRILCVLCGQNWVYWIKRLMGFLVNTWVMARMRLAVNTVSTRQGTSFSMKPYSHKFSWKKDSWFLYWNWRRWKEMQKTSEHIKTLSPIIQFAHLENKQIKGSTNTIFHSLMGFCFDVKFKKAWDC